MFYGKNTDNHGGEGSAGVSPAVASVSDRTRWWQWSSSSSPSPAKLPAKSSAKLPATLLAPWALLALMLLFVQSCTLINTTPTPVMGSYQYDVELIHAIKTSNPTYCAYDGLVVLKIADKESTLSYSSNRYTLKASLKKDCTSGNVTMVLFGPLNIPVATAAYNSNSRELKYSSSYDKDPEANAQSIYRVLVTYGNLLTIPLKTPEEYYNVTTDYENNTYQFRSTVDVIIADHNLKITSIYLNNINGTVGYEYRRDGGLKGIAYEDELYTLQMSFQGEWKVRDGADE